MAIIFLFVSIIIWVFFERKITDYAQPIWFFTGGIGQMLIVNFIFKNYRFYDPRCIFMARIARGHAFDYIIKVNSYLTMANQVFNAIIFITTYTISTFVCI
jgi:hypothetical protein